MFSFYFAVLCFDCDQLRQTDLSDAHPAQIPLRFATGSSFVYILKEDTFSEQVRQGIN
jgi:hypothetical protein